MKPLSLDAILGVTRITVSESQRLIVLENGAFSGVFGPGRHSFQTRGRTLETELHDLNKGELVSKHSRALFRERPDLAAEHLTEFTTGPAEIGVLVRDNAFFGVLKPEGRTVVWNASGAWEMLRFDAGESLEVPPAVARRFARSGLGSTNVTRIAVGPNQAGLLHVDGVLTERLAPGVRMYWNVGRTIEVKLVDLRRQALDVLGQEILTMDRVSIRVNLAADYRVVDPEKAVSAVADFSNALYRALQYAFRKTLGAKTLDEILEQKVSVDAEAAAQVRSEMAEIGLEVGEIALKDVILPGDMREILNEVVSAEKQAQANVIRRREETAATRSLLNTAKVMAENPIMLRLKELEALEQIAEKVDRLVIHNGPKGLLEDVARLREDDDER